jgi:hypothetical protein
MKGSKIKKGTIVWIPCEVQSGPFPNERRVYVKLDDSEWFGFVDVSQLKEKVPQGTDCVQATVLGIQNQRVVLGIHGQAPASGPLETTPTAIGGLAPVPT